MKGGHHTTLATPPHARWLSKLRGYEVTMRFDAETFDRAD